MPPAIFPRITLVVIVLLAVLGIVVVSVITPHGNGTSPDSIRYVAAARSLLAGDGLQDTFEGVRFRYWPPGYPVLLTPVVALSDAADTTIYQGARWLNALLFAGVILAAGALCWVQVRFKPLAAFGAAAVLLSDPLLQASFFILTELPYMLVSLLCLLALVIFLRNPTPRWLVAAAILAGLMTMLRFIGATMVVAGVVVIVVFWVGTPLLKRLRYAAGFGVVAGTPLGLWWLYNLIDAQSVAGERRQGEPFRRLASRITAEISRWLLPEELWLGFYDVGVLLVIAAAVIIVIAHRRARTAGRAPTLDDLAQAVPVPVSLTYAGGFLAANLALGTNVMVTQDTNRLLQPVYPVVICVLIGVVDVVAGWLAERTGRPQLVQTVTVGVLLIGLITPARVFWDKADTLAGADYNQESDMALVAELRARDLDGALYSNIPRAVVMNTRHDADGVPLTLAAWDGMLAPGQTAQLIWFEDRSHCVDGIRGGLEKQFCYKNLPYTPGDLAALETLQVELVVEAAEGAIYALTGVAE